MQQEISYNSDGCSWVPDFWFRDCCIQHDLGGTDLELAQCIVANTSPELYPIGILLAIIYFIGLKLFGWIYQLYKRRKNDNI
jgi:hypothetical protein